MKPNPLLKSMFAIPIGLVLMIVSLLDAGHLFRFHRRLGGDKAYLFLLVYQSLEKHVKCKLYYMYIIYFIWCSSHNFIWLRIRLNTDKFNLLFYYIRLYCSELLSIPIAFRKSTEFKTERVSYIAYIILIMFVLPFLLSVILILINYIFLNHSQIPYFLFIFLNYGFLVLSVIGLIINYIIQINKIKTYSLKEVYNEIRTNYKKYGHNTVIDHIDFDFGNSQIVGLIGKNGVGKTTLMKVMNGNIINFEGKVNLPNDENVGYLIEHPKLYDNKTGLYNLKLFAQVLGKGFDKSMLIIL